jgi:hypothetical protein
LVIFNLQLLAAAFSLPDCNSKREREREREVRCTTIKDESEESGAHHDREMAAVTTPNPVRMVVL